MLEADMMYRARRFTRRGARLLFAGLRGSMGNDAAMRVVPLGAYYAGEARP